MSPPALYSLSLHDALPIFQRLEGVDFVGAIETLAKRFGVELEYEEISPEAEQARKRKERLNQLLERATVFYERVLWESDQGAFRSEEHTSELQSLRHLVCR